MTGHERGKAHSPTGDDKALEAARKIEAAGDALAVSNAEIRAMARALLSALSTKQEGEEVPSGRDAPSDEHSTWRPMASAPRVFGKRFIGWSHERGITDTYYEGTYEDDGEPCWMDFYADDAYHPTYWLPMDALPPMPQEGLVAGEEQDKPSSVCTPSSPAVSPTPEERWRASSGPLPCPFCGVALVQLGDYTPDGGWNWWQHPIDDDLNTAGNCVAKDIKLNVNWYEPSKDIIAWNRRALKQAADVAGEDSSLA